MLLRTARKMGIALPKEKRVGKLGAKVVLLGMLTRDS
jgi:hypothetical protein